jgi:hypothetical protein
MIFVKSEMGTTKTCTEIGDLGRIVANNHAAMWEHQGDDLAERQRERPVLRDDLFAAGQGSVRHLAQWSLIGSQ